MKMKALDVYGKEKSIEKFVGYSRSKNKQNKKFH